MCQDSTTPRRSDKARLPERRAAIGERRATIKRQAVNTPGNAAAQPRSRLTLQAARDLQVSILDDHQAAALASRQVGGSPQLVPRAT
jgi:hypothetical protein